MIARYLSLGAAAALAFSAVASAQTTPPMEEMAQPTRFSGIGLNVIDIEKAKAFYTEILGFKVALRIPGKDGSSYEYILSLDGTIAGGTLLVLTNHAPGEGSSSFGRLVLVVPDGRALAERVVAHGGTAEKIVDGTNFVRDPEGNLVELYQRPVASTAK